MVEFIGFTPLRETLGKLNSKPVSPAQMLYAKKIAQGKGLIIPEVAKANAAAMSAWINSNRSAKRRERGRKSAYKLARSVAPRPTAATKRSRKRKPDASAAPLAPAQPNFVTGGPPGRVGISPEENELCASPPVEHQDQQSCHAARNQHEPFSGSKR